MTDLLFDTNVAQTLIDPRAAKQTPALLAEVEARVRQQGGLVISVVTAYELRRGVRVLRLRAQGRRKEVRVERLIRSADVLGLDVPAFGAWTVAAELFAQGSVRSPSIVIADADLLIAATAKRARWSPPTRGSPRTWRPSVRGLRSTCSEPCDHAVFPAIRR